MKNLIMVIVVAMAFSGCKQIIDFGTDCAAADRYSEIPIYYGGFYSIKVEEQIPFWMTDRVTYRMSNDLATPEQAVVTGYGDCEEFALLYLNILYVVFGKKGELCLVEYGRTVEAGGRSCNHAVVRYDGKLIEPLSGSVVHYEVCYSYKFDDIFN